MKLGEKVKGFLFNPTATFNAVKTEALGEAFKYFLILLLIFSIILAALTAILGTAFTSLLSPILPIPLLGAAVAIVAVLILIFSIVVGIIGAVISGLWFHIWVYLVGGRKGLTQTMKAVMYSYTPSLLLGWIPLIGLISTIWSIIIMIIGFRELHELSTGRAILAWLISALVIGIIVAMIGLYIPSSTPK